MIESKYSTVLSTYQKDQYLPSFHCKVWWGLVEWHHQNFIFFSNDCTSRLQTTLKFVGLVIIATWFLLLNFTKLIFRIFDW